MQPIKGYPEVGDLVTVEDLAQPPHKRWITGRVLPHPRHPRQPYVTRFRTGLVACAIDVGGRRKWIPWTSDTSRVRYYRAQDQDTGILSPILSQASA